MADATPGLTLHELKPAEGSHRERKRIGRGHGSGSGKTAGRGQKGQKSRSGSHSMRPGFEGGQMPLYMRLGKAARRQPQEVDADGAVPHPYDARECGGARALRRRRRGDADLLRSAGVVCTLKHPIKILGKGELSTKLTVTADAFSKRAVEVIEAAGGTAVSWTAPPRLRSPRRRPRPRRSARSGRGPPSRSPKRPNLRPSLSRPSPSPRPTPRGVLQNLLNAWKSPELRKKLLFTAAMLAIYRFGSYVPAPGVNSDALSEALKNQGGIFGLLSVFSGGGLCTARRVRARDHAVHHGLDHPPGHDAGVPVAPGAPEGGRAGAAPDHAVHALSDGVPGQPAGARLHVCVSTQRSRGSSTGNLVSFNLGNVILIVVTLTAVRPCSCGSAS